MKLLKRIEFISPAVKLGAAAAKWASAGFPLADTETLALREEICGECRDWNASAFGGLGRCEICGCTKLKRNMTTEKCPKGKW